MKPILSLLISCALVAVASCQEVRTVKVNVTEEDGTPIEGVNTTVTFLGYKSDQTTREEGITDGQGFFEAEGEPLLRMSVRAEKEGYYANQSGRLSRKENHNVTLVLRKVKNPIPLYAKKVILGMPVNREWVGYDFEVGDWVAPYGQGKVKDALFKCDTEKTGERKGRGSLEIKFDDDEGFLLESKNYHQLSDMKLPHKAPSKGYQRLFNREEKSYHNKNARVRVGYFFRSRVEREEGKIVSANYGKILADIRFSPRHFEYKGKPKKFATISFTYYFNPSPNDRNLEFDLKQNLFKSLDTTEQVREP